ncbi:MAG: polysaccharide deacetylase family protein [Chitinophagales bacterium]|nr:polysaccharide deacetylase family protein [Chitinophagales bacterium]
MRSFFSRVIRFAGIHDVLRKEKKSAVTVLCFHRVNDEKNIVWPSTGTAMFRNIMLYCKRYYSVILPEDWQQKTINPKLIITFDDGFGDFMHYALPILSQYNFPAVHNVVIDSVLNSRPNWTYRLNMILENHVDSNAPFSLKKFNIDYCKLVTLKNVSAMSLEAVQLLKDFTPSEIGAVIEGLENPYKERMVFPEMMDRSNLLECESAGIRIGSHGWSHLLVDGPFSDSILHHEIVDSRNELQKLLNHPVPYFAFPAAHYNERAVNFTAAAGYPYLFAAGDIFFYQNTMQEFPIIFPRIVTPTSGADEAILKMEGFHSSIKKWRNTLNG